ncbi:uncharacterized protein LOC142354934 [Convolutriloba macropyga]|uniref:uncharacterized protein LOC142354934 n=1 Tax=Convolutriloba macropyga TaxID=536237 RepID=UPI003F51E2CD
MYENGRATHIDSRWKVKTFYNANSQTIRLNGSSVRLASGCSELIVSFMLQDEQLVDSINLYTYTGHQELGERMEARFNSKTDASVLIDHNMEEVIFWVCFFIINLSISTSPLITRNF